MKTKVAAIMVGRYGHGHSIAFQPNAIMSVVGALGDNVNCRVFDEIYLGHQTLNNLVSEFDPDVVLISVPVSGYYDSAIELATYWAYIRGKRVLLGGYHFSIPGSRIPELAAKRLRLPICCGDGRPTVVGFMKYIEGQIPLEDVPNLVFIDNQNRLIRTHQVSVGIDDEKVATLPLDVIDPRVYWDRVNEVDQLSQLHIGRTCVGPNIVRGCTYRSALHKHGKSACNFCTLTGEHSAASGLRFWELMRKMYEHVLSFEWNGDPGVMCYHIGDDMGSDREFVRDVHNTMPNWAKESNLRHRMYAWHVANTEHAKQLREIGVRWLYVGADGKVGFTNRWSDGHPLLRTLNLCRLEGLAVRTSFVLGQPGQTWDDIKQWESFKAKVFKEFGSSMSIVSQGWVNVVTPGSPNWQRLVAKYPILNESDVVDLEYAQIAFIRYFTQLCDGGRDAGDVLQELYRIAESFDSGRKSPFIKGAD